LSTFETYILLAGIQIH